MPHIFRGVAHPDDRLADRIAELAPENPFYTAQYLAARKQNGSTPCLLMLENEGEIVAGCSAFLSSGRLNSRLEITSLPSLPDVKAFWDGLFDFCSLAGVSVLSVHTFGSLETKIAENTNRVSLSKRSEFRLDLSLPDLWSIMHRRHMRLVKRGRASKLSITRRSDAAARASHVELANDSLDRHRVRGETVLSSITRRDVDALLDNGAGELMQAGAEGQTHSSILLARSRTGAYAQSSGTSEEGRKIGASHFLFHNAAVLLKDEGAEVFNLGGTDEFGAGLREFKLGLGAAKVELESAEFYLGSGFRRIATRAAAFIKGSSGFPIGT
jgi:hypothetical protein